jgi:hypothetical protein
MSNHGNRHDLLERVLHLSDGAFSHELARHILNVHIPAADQARYDELSAKAQHGTLKPKGADGTGRLPQPQRLPHSAEGEGRGVSRGARGRVDAR